MRQPKMPVRRLLLPLLGVLMVTSCGSGSSSDSSTATPTTPPPMPPARADRAFFGMHDASLTSLQPGTGVGAIRAWDAGVAWNQIETTQGQYDWSNLDRIVTAAQRAHVQVTMVLALTPSFYSSDPTKPPHDLADYQRFATALMSRYRDFHGSRGISSYQVWNEGNVVNSWTGTQQQLAQLSKVLYDVRQKVDPGAQLVSPPMAARLPTQQKWLTTFFAQQVGGEPVWKFFDVIGLNLYPLDQYGGVPGGPEDSMKLLDQTRAALSADHVPTNLPIWNTEVNYGLKGAAKVPHAAPIPEAEQAANVVRTYLLNAAAGVDRVFWYRWDWGMLPQSIGGGTLGNTLLTDPSDASVRTAAGKALVVAERWMTADGAQPPKCSQDSSGTYTCTITHTGGTRHIYWNPTAKAQVTVPAGSTTSETVSGASTQVKAGATLEVSFSPVMVDTAG